MKRVIIFCIIIVLAQTLTAKPVVKKTVAKVALNFMQYRQPDRKYEVKKILAEKYKNQVVYYTVVFKESGWILISADDRINPILAYSLNGRHIDFDDIPPAAKFLLNKYKEQIQNSKEKNIVDSTAINKWNRLIKNKFESKKRFNYTPGTILLNTSRGQVAWGQSKNNDGSCTPSYNEFCPSGSKCNCNNYSAGCGAVAMAQIMWYYKWPNRAYIPMVEYGGITLPYSYDWQLMPTKINNSTNTEAADHIARLLRHCGRATFMNYGKKGSWTTTDNIVNAFKNNFYYKSVKKIKRNEFDSNTWRGILRNEIDNGKPVIYRGGKILWEGDVHYFVIDGYHATIPEHFHINFGWRGSSNGYYTVDNITPNDHNYNDNQHAIIGIHPSCDDIPESISDVSYTQVNDNQFANEQAKENIDIPASGKTLAIKNNGKLILTAGNSVKLNKGFKVESGGSFRIEIEQVCVDCQGDIDVEQVNNIMTPNGDGINDEACFDVSNASTYISNI